MPVLFNKESGLAEDLAPDVAQSAVAAGTHEVPLVDPTGAMGSAPHADAPGLLQQGYRQPNVDELNKILKTAKFNSTEEQLKTGLEGAGSALTLGASTAIERGMGVKADDINARAEANPGVHALGEMAGLGVGLLGGVGEAELLGQAGKAVEAKLAPVIADNFIGRVGTQAAKAAAENMLFQSGSEASKLFASDPHQTVETAAADIGLAGLIGAGFGAGLGGGSELWKLGPGKKVASILDAVKNRAAGLPSELKAAAGIEIPPELDQALAGSTTASDNVAHLAESNTSAGNKVRAAIDSVRADADTALTETLGTTPEEARNVSDYEVGAKAQKEIVAEVKAKYEPIKKEYEAISEQFKAAPVDASAKATVADSLANVATEEGWAKMPSGPGNRILNKVLEELPLQETAEDLRKYASNLKSQNPFGSEGYRPAKLLAKSLNDAAEGAIVNRMGLEAPDAIFGYNKVKADYAALRDTFEELNNALRSGKIHGPESFAEAIATMDPEQVLKRLAPNGDVNLLQLMQQHFPEALETVRKHELVKLIRQAAGKGERAFDINKFVKALDKLSPEMKAFVLPEATAARVDALKTLLDKMPAKANPSGTARTLDKLWSSVPASATGIVSMIAGHSGILGYILGAVGHHVGKEAPDAVKLAMLKFMGSSEATSSEGFRAAVKLASATIKGETKLQGAVDNVFNIGKKVIAEPSLKDLDKLREHVRKVADNENKPEDMLNVGSAVGHYMPEQGSAMAEASQRNLQYLASVMPSTHPQGILDDKIKPNKVAEADYTQALLIAQSPLIVMKSIKDGTLTLSEIKHMQVMYPALYGRMSEKLTNGIVKLKTEQRAIPYKTRMSLSMFMGQPLDSSMTPAAIIASQPLPMQQPRLPQSIKVGSKLDKLPSTFNTMSGAGEARRSRPGH